MRRVVAPVFAVFAVAVLALVLAAAALRPGRRESPPLPAARRVVLLLVPGVSLSELRAGVPYHETPALAHLLSGRYPFGVMPTKVAPGADPLGQAVRMLACGRRSPAPDAPCLGAVLERSGAKTALLTDLEAAQAFAPPGTALPWEQPWQAPDRDFPDGYVTAAAALNRAVKAALPPNADGTAFLAVALFDDLYRAHQYAPLALPEVTARNREAALLRLDRLVAALTGPDGLPDGTALLMACPVSSPGAETSGERLGPVFLWTRPNDAAAPPSRLLASPSTRGTRGLLAATDLAATLAALLGAPEADRHVGDGRPAYLVPGTPDAFIRQVGAWASQVREQRVLVGVPWALAAAFLGAAVLRSLGRHRLAGALAIWAAAVPAALWLAPLAASGLSVFALAAGFALAPALCALRGPAAAVLRAVGLLTALVAVVDLATGGALLSRSPLSYSVVEAARYYGIGNESSGVLLGAALAASPLFPTWAALVWGGAALLAAGLPMLGADAGSVAGGAAGFGALAALAAPPHRRRVAAGAVLLVAVLLVAGYAAWEGARDAGERTHVGEAVAAGRSQGPGAVIGIAKRKALVNLRLLVTSPWAVLLYTEGMVLAYLWRRAGREALTAPQRAALGAPCVGCLVLLLANDSGVVAGATCLLFPAAGLLTTAEAPPPRDTDAK